MTLRQTVFLSVLSSGSGSALGGRAGWSWRLRQRFFGFADFRGRQTVSFGAALADSFFETLLKVFFIFGVFQTIFIGDLFADNKIFETLIHRDHTIAAAGLHDRQQLVTLVFFDTAANRC